MQKNHIKQTSHWYAKESY